LSDEHTDVAAQRTRTVNHNTNNAHNDEVAQPLDTTPEIDPAAQLPANDTSIELDEGGFQPDADDEPANDTDDDDASEDAFAVERDPRLYDWLEEPGRLETCLERAGYHAALVPEDIRRAAFEVALCYQKRVFDFGDIAEITSFTRGLVRRSVETLRVAAKPGTTVA
jgi:hypothetical protein